MVRLVVVLIVLGACGCTSKRDGAARAGGGDGAAPGGDGAATADAAAAATARDAGPRPPQPVPEADVEALLERWLEVQNAGDFAGYDALYADGFRGVRRSGKQTVRMDRARWMADRKKMFKKPMKVVATDVEIAATATGARIQLTQEWSSGTYHDVGPKEIALSLEPTGLRIIREEMLRSRMTRSKFGDGTLLLVHRGMVVVAPEVDPGWATGAPRLDDGTVPDHDPTCDSAPPDYERDHERYWDCASSDPDTAYGDFVASQAVDPARLPAALRAWQGRELRLGGAGVECAATVDGFRLHAETRAKYGEVTARGDDDDAIAAVVLATGRPVLVGTLTGGCKAAWAVPAAQPEPVIWRIAKAPAHVVTGIETAVGPERLDEAAREAPYDASGDTVAIDGPPRSPPLAMHEITGCGTRGAAFLFGLGAGSPTPTYRLLYEGPAVGVVAALDSDGDGWPEIVVDGGVLRRDPDSGDYDHVEILDFPAGYVSCVE
jgi:hypothetical protein